MPAGIDDIEPKALAECRVRTKPSLEATEGILPVGPGDGDVLHGASVGAEIVGIEGF